MEDLFKDRRLILAPMAGVTDEVFRELCIEAGAQLTYTEMVSAKALSYGSGKTRDLLVLAPSEKQVALQIFGHEPETMAQEAYELEQMLGHAVFSFDVNMGCPARKIAGKGDGAALMRDPLLASRIVEAMANKVEHPVTVKMRRGFAFGEETAPELAHICLLYTSRSASSRCSWHRSCLPLQMRSSIAWVWEMSLISPTSKRPVLGDSLRLVFR